MPRPRRDTDEPIGPIEIIPNFLPPPDQLVLREAKPTTAKRKSTKATKKRP